MGLYTLLIKSVSSLRRGHANLLCIVPIYSDDRQVDPNILPGICINCLKIMQILFKGFDYLTS